ncbi:MAG: NfeD family protein [Huintestinicola sp.]
MEKFMMIIWVIMLIATAVAEAATCTLISIWFTLGSLAALIAAICGAPLFLQMIIFFAVSILALVLTRPALKKLMPKKYIPTNGEDDIGRTAVVTETIEPSKGKGRVVLDDVYWGAVSEDGSDIPEGATVIITAKGVSKLTVKKQG